MRSGPHQTNKSFLVLFLKKNRLPFDDQPLPRRQRDHSILPGFEPRVLGELLAAIGHGPFVVVQDQHPARHDAVEQGIQRGEFNADIDPVLIAGEMQAFASGIETQWFLDRDNDRFMRTYEAYSTALAKRICTPIADA
jgi:hypothetical protein